MDIKCVMLTSGQPVLYVDEGDDMMTEPALLFVYPTEDGKQNVTFQHMLAFSDESKCERLAKEMKLVEYSVGKGQMHEHFCAYVQNQRIRRSGIVMPTGSGIVSTVEG